MENCPAGSTRIYDERIGQEHEDERAWGFFDTAFNCKVVISARGLNGKINVKIEEVTGTNLVVYEMPNHFSSSYKSTGIIENNRVYKDVGAGSHVYVPSDWSIWLVYSPKFGGGKIRFRHWADDFNEGDKSRISGEWQPTGTKYIDAEEEQKKENERLAKEAAIQAQLEADLKAAKEAADKAEQDRLAKEAEKKKKEEEAKLEAERKAQQEKDDAERQAQQEAEQATIDANTGVEEIAEELESDMESGFNTGGFVGLLIGLSILMCIICAGVWYYIRRRNAAKRLDQVDPLSQIPSQVEMGGSQVLSKSMQKEALEKQKLVGADNTEEKTIDMKISKDDQKEEKKDEEKDKNFETAKE